KTLEQMTSILKRAGYLLKKNTAFVDAFNAFIGNENFEERADPNGQWIDKPVLKYLVKKFGK
ncbi:MAG TPA: putative peptidoglycan binding domain-containing protein, partial [Anaerolineales bacterium]|nr:putative peptidoglycan binding domain-containing protein [Anaerolineales bacterium]